MGKLKCPCGVTWTGLGVTDSVVCPKCGRRYHRWSDGKWEWLKHPAEREADRIISLGTGHFRTMERILGRLERRVIAIEKVIAPKPPRKRRT